MSETTYFSFQINTLLVSIFLVSEFKNKSFIEATNFTDCLTKVSPLNRQFTLLELTKEAIIQK